MKTTGRIVLTFLVVACAASAAPGGSIWAKAHCAGDAPRPLHSDDTARRVGDMLTIVIDERSVVINETNRDMNKTSTRKASVASNLDLLDAVDTVTGELFSIPELEVDNTAETDFEGEANYDTDRQVLDEMTVTVADVLPNGNLVVVGSRTRSTAGDEQIIQVSGVVRPSDITFANTVRSEQVAEFSLVVKQCGRENRFTKPGWLDRFLNIVNPF